ncbi:Parathyroid hormone/parathyroid hormone- peptide receptor [Bulinus truncatus]|nr:Parathyroid hormone/parathyroid hormone- peptide receptor [Bulinus truncatus]
MPVVPSKYLPGLHLMLLYLLPKVACDIVNGSMDYQRYKLWLAEIQCHQLRADATKPDDGGKYCPPVWDNIMCWPNYTRAGETARQNCADYIHGFRTTEKAERYCEENGEWRKNAYNPGLNSSWTNYTFCHGTDVPPILLSNMFIITKISTVGYSVSLVCLVLATAVMVFLKRLHCQRNTIHINLFISFIFRAIISLMKDGLLVNGFALQEDVMLVSDGIYKFKEEGSHWECKLLYTLSHYSLSANYMWIFVEGLYLHTLVFFAVFSQSKKFFKIYIIIGWVFPLVFVITWVIVRIYASNTFCWNTHEKGHYWILNGPIVVSIIVNFVFFLNIMRMLFTKIRSTNTRDPGRYSIQHFDDWLIPFQGTVIAFLFCFLNGEVRAEIAKKWNRHWLRRQSVVSNRSSRAFSTTSFYIGRERTSLSQGTTLPDIFCRDGSALTPPSSPFNNNNAIKFHKVASMPKMHFSSSLPKPIPRVASSPKVTFSCSEPSADIGHHSVTIGGSSPKSKNGTLPNGIKKDSDIEEKKSLLTNSSPPGKMVSADLGTHQASNNNHKVREAASPKLKGSNEEGSPRITHVSSATVLPPLMDEEEEEEGSETSQMI